MATRVTITGTGTPVFNAHRAGPGALVQVDVDGDVISMQFDAGRSTLARLVAAGVSLYDLDAVFLTHYHSDHLLGLQDLVLSHWIMDSEDDRSPLPILAPLGSTTRFAERMLSIWDDDLDVRSHHNHRSPEPKIDIVGFEVEIEPAEVWEKAGVRVLAGPVRHEPVVGAVGYRIETPDGVVAISGDTLVCDEVARLAEGADILVYEAMRFDPIRSRPPHLRYIADYHADTRLIGAQAADLDIPTLMLTHLIPAPSNEADKQAFVGDIRGAGFTGELIVCDDLDVTNLESE
jgi:ribonuclease Z